MTKTKFFHFDFFERLQSNASFYEKIIDESRIRFEISRHLLWLILLSLVYGAIMGSYNSPLQALSSALKMPLLFLLIILICFPAFYVIQTVLGSRLSIGQMISIILTGFVFMISIMVSFSTIIIFFLITGDNYAFIKLLHVLIISVSGFFGMRTIIEALKYSCEKKSVYPKTGVHVFRVWIIILAFVGAQLSWSMRPFVGSPNSEFQVLRQKGGNFYIEVLHSIGRILD